MTPSHAMHLLDSNIVIYATSPSGAGLHQFVRAQDTAVSAVSRVEVLGYHQLTPLAEAAFHRFFQLATVFAVTDRVIDRAISLRQTRKMSLGDALIAATALVHAIPLVTRNVNDFRWINGLTVLNPFGLGTTGQP